MNRREFLKSAAALALAPAAACVDVPSGRRPNVLLITLDDVNAESIGCYGSRTPDPTPNVDRLAAGGMRFERGHVNISVCRASRAVMMTGRYPHRNGSLSSQPIADGVPVLPVLLREAGYTTGILGKVDHLRHPAGFRWNYWKFGRDMGEGRDPARYGEYARIAFRRAADSGRPFFLMANVHDAHRPFAGSPEARAWSSQHETQIPEPSRSFRPQEVRVPGFLPKLPGVRSEIAWYYGSVRRADDSVGRILEALDATGLAENTLVILISDNGMSFPFAKLCCYSISTRMPWIVRWPGVVESGRVDVRHFVSALDLMPTILDAAGAAPPGGMDGSSFLPLLAGGSQPGRDRVFTMVNEDWFEARPTRSVLNGRFSYIFNPWSDGRARFVTESQRGLTMRALKRAAQTDASVAARVRLFVHRVPEELYDVVEDPYSLRNLVDAPDHGRVLERMRGELLESMLRTEDPVAPALRERIGT